MDALCPRRLRGRRRKQYGACRFPREFAAIPGVISDAQDDKAGDGEAKPSDLQPVPSGRGVTPPRPILTPEPDFSEQARQAHYQGTIVLLIVVDKNGRGSERPSPEALGSGAGAESD